MTALSPLMLLAVATTTWLVVSRTLQPVEAIRRHVAEPIPRRGTGDEIDRLVATMNEMLARQNRSAARQREFVSDASHELGSPITATIATVETWTRPGWRSSGPRSPPPSWTSRIGCGAWSTIC
ncbi:MAG: hypothetical protein ACK5RL_10760 [Acidimicrobiales bacterium]